MATFYGFNTINQEKKFTLTDFDLVVRDFINTMMIRQGEIVGRPDYGSRIWDFIFEPKTPDTVSAIYAEVERLASLDPRIAIANQQLYHSQHSVIVELEMSVQPDVNPRVLEVLFDQGTRIITYRLRT